MPEPFDRDDGKWAAKQVYQKGDMKPLCEFVEERYFKAFKRKTLCTICNKKNDEGWGTASRKIWRNIRKKIWKSAA